MNQNSRLQFSQTGTASATIFDGGVKIAEIRDLQLCNVRFRPEMPICIGDTVMMPLYWWQYHDHQHPDRHAGSHGKLSLLQSTPQEIIFACTGTNATGSILSRYHIRLLFSALQQSYVFHIQARLSIPRGAAWHVTRNPAHGELEFCNIWPAGAFSTTDQERKLYHACLLQRGSDIIRIPHHHLETSDKHDLHMKKNDRFLWVLEQMNPVVEMLSEEPVSAGVCAYMWDAHFGYRVTTPLQSTTILHGEKEYAAEFQFYAIDRTAGADLQSRAVTVPPPDLDDIPIYIDKVNTFAPLDLLSPEQLQNCWPWSHEQLSTGIEAASFCYDHQVGYDDRFSLHIENHQAVTSRWMVTTLGPAFGQPLFPNRARFRLTGYLRTEEVDGVSHLIIRLHRPGHGDVFNPLEYEMYKNQQGIQGTCSWQKVEIITPPISPAPDRLHLILQQQGRGKTWFDNIYLEIMD